MNYKCELEKYLNSSKSKLDDSAMTTKANKIDLTNNKHDSTLLRTTAAVLNDSSILPTHKYYKVIEECLNFEDVDTRKVFNE
jgi:hypothetical protein